MSALDGMRTAFRTITERLAAVRRGSHFTCGDCDRSERCGLAPDPNCIVKASQIDRDGDNKPRPPGGYYTAVWPR